MGTRGIAVVVALVGAGLGLTPPAAQACEPTAPTITLPNPRREQPVYDWNGDFTAESVRFRSRTCADLNGTLFRPTDGLSGDRPTVLVVPPSGGVADESQLFYVARTLATHGYIAMTVDPQGVGDSGVLSEPACTTEPGRTNPSPCPGVPFQQMDSWMEAARSALDFLLTVDGVDASRVGAVGHSLGARASSYLQDPFFDDAGEQRVHAVVGLDNISSNYCGDASAGGGGTYVNDLVVGQPVPCDQPIAINAPALGLASDNATNADPDLKKFAFERWRDAQVPSGMLVFEGVAHEAFSQGARADEALLHRVADYTVAWFDRWLRNDLTATQRLLAPIDPTLLSDTQRSAWYLPMEHETDDFRSEQSAM